MFTGLALSSFVWIEEFITDRMTPNSARNRVRLIRMVSTYEQYEPIGN